MREKAGRIATRPPIEKGLGFSRDLLFEPLGKPLEPGREGEKLFAPAEVIAELGSNLPELLGDAPQVFGLDLGILVHSAPRTSAHPNRINVYQNTIVRGGVTKLWQVARPARHMARVLPLPGYG